MQNKKNNLTEEILNKIISAAYKDAGLIERLKIYLLIKKDTEAKKIFNEYRRTAEVVKGIPLDKCPDSVAESVKIENERKFTALKPAYVSAAFLSVVIISAIILFQSRESDPVYTREEIELAEEQVKESLAIINKVFRKTENLIQEDVLPKRVGKPIHKSFTIINDVLTGG